VGKRIEVADLVGAHEIAHRLGVARPQVAHEWRRRHEELPGSIATLKSALIWDWRVIKAWALITGRDTESSGRGSDN